LLPVNVNYPSPKAFGVDAAHKRFGIVFVVARLINAPDSAATTYDGQRPRSFLGLLPATVGDTDAKAMSSLLVIGPVKGNRIIQILSAINYRFLGPNSR
jgi:hypothetical protein